MLHRCTSAVAAAVLLAGCAGATRGSPAATQAGSTSTAPLATASARPTASPDLVPGAKRTPRDGEIEPGRYYTPKGALTPVTFAFDIAASGWIAQNDGQTISKNVDDVAREISWSVEIVDELFATPCGANDVVPIGPTAEDLVVGLQALPDLAVSEPAGLTIDGRAGKVVELSVPAALDFTTCDPPIGVQVWIDAVGEKFLVVLGSAVTRLYVVDVEGARFIVNVNIAKTADPAELAELEAIVASITFHP